MSKYIDGAIVLSIITVLLYCVGLAFFNGYYAHFSINPDVLNKGFNQLTYQGFILIWSSLKNVPLISVNLLVNMFILFTSVFSLFLYCGFEIKFIKKLKFVSIKSFSFIYFLLSFLYYFT